jgi:polyisoprenoid-binding protein YceI
MPLALDKSKGKIEFLAVGNPGFLKINGKGAAPKGDLQVEGNKVKGELELDLSSLDTGMSLRNKHMKEKYLEVGKYPKAILIIKDQALPKTFSLGTELKDQKLNAELKMHNKSQPVIVTYSIDATGSLNAEFEIKITDYGIDLPSFMGVTVADKVTIKVNSKLNKSEQKVSKVEP